MKIQSFLSLLSMAALATLTGNQIAQALPATSSSVNSYVNTHGERDYTFQNSLKVTEDYVESGTLASESAGFKLEYTAPKSGDFKFNLNPAGTQGGVWAHQGEHVLILDTSSASSEGEYALERRTVFTEAQQGTDWSGYTGYEHTVTQTSNVGN